MDKANSTDPHFLTTGAAGRRLGVSSHTVIRYIAAGTLPALRVGRGQRRIRVDDVERLAENSTTKAKAQA